MIKRYIPKNIKQFLWFIFKSPQRKWVGWRSLLTDVKGYFTIWFVRGQLHRITVCVGVSNRSRHLLDHLIDSMNRANNKSLLNLSVYDCGSDDVVNLAGAIQEKWKGKLFYNRQEQPFARSLAFNSAVRQSDTPVVLICDADMSLPADIVVRASKFISRRTAWFPVVWYTNADGSGRYYTESTGMLCTFKDDFFRVGAYDERIREWGKEDWLLFFEYYKHDIACIRTRERYFVHHYHPSLRPEGFVPLF